MSVKKTEKQLPSYANSMTFFCHLEALILDSSSVKSFTVTKNVKKLGLKRAWAS